mmetsp:Transcript_180/g.380  ORF Transcript_180/g.380 Transcript_180/m.380 type:complete len:131 (+) Transcript_180:1113-1505(+)
MLVNAAGERRRDAPGGCFCAFDAGTGARAGGGVLVMIKCVRRDRRDGSQLHAQSKCHSNEAQYSNTQQYSSLMRSAQTTNKQTNKQMSEFSFQAACKTSKSYAEYSASPTEPAASPNSTYAAYRAGLLSC